MAQKFVTEPNKINKEKDFNLLKLKPVLLKTDEQKIRSILRKKEKVLPHVFENKLKCDFDREKKRT